MTRHDVTFAAARCRILVEPTFNDDGVRAFTATMAAIDESTRTIRLLVALSGRPVTVRADSERRALALAAAFLERWLGSFRGITPPWDRAGRFSSGDPITLAV